MARRFRLGLAGVLVTIGVVAISACNDGRTRSPFAPSVTLSSAPQPPTPAPPPPPSVPVASGYSVSGVVSEIVDGAEVPVAGVHVEDSSRHVFVMTAEDGSYTLRNVETYPGDGHAHFYFQKQGYRSVTRAFVPAGTETRLDVEIVRQ